MANITFDITESYFDVNLANSYNLSVLIGTDRFFFLIADSHKNIVRQRTYAFPPIKSAIELVTVLQNILTKDTSLLYHYQTTKVTFIHFPFVLVPYALYDDEHPEATFQHTSFLSGLDYLFIDDLPNNELKNVYTIPKSVFNLLKNHFVNIQFYHLATPFISATQSLSNFQSTLFINVNQYHFQVAAYKNTKLQLYNIYPYENDDEFLYFVLLVIRQLKFNTDTSIILSGGIAKASIIYKKLSIYLKNLTFAQRPSFYQYNNTQFKEVAEHSFFDLYSLSLCG